MSTLRRFAKPGTRAHNEISQYEHATGLGFEFMRTIAGLLALLSGILTTYIVTLMLMGEPGGGALLTLWGTVLLICLTFLVTTRKGTQNKVRQAYNEQLSQGNIIELPELLACRWDQFVSQHLGFEAWSEFEVRRWQVFETLSISADIELALLNTMCACEPPETCTISAHSPEVREAVLADLVERMETALQPHIQAFKAAYT